MHAKDHMRLTSKAIEIYRQYSSSNAGERFHDYRRTMMVGSKEADTTPVLTRLTNWHFYKADCALEPDSFDLSGLLPTVKFYPTSEILLAKRICQLKKEAKKGLSRDFFELVGRVLHHIQDMSTPAHVVPVYHGPKIKDSFETFSAEHIKHYVESVEISQGEFEAVASENSGDLMKVYDDAAEATLAALRDSGGRIPARLDGEETVIGWEAFWDGSGQAEHEITVFETIKFKGFGSYGPLGKHFAASAVDTPEGRYQIGLQVYKDFYLMILKKAVLDSLRALHCIERLMPWA